MPVLIKPLAEAHSLNLLFNAIDALFTALIEHGSLSFREFIKAFPSPFEMLDAIIGFFTGIPGVFLAIPATTMKDIMLDWAKDNKLHNKLIRFDDAIRMVFIPFEEIIQIATLSGKSNLLTVLAGMAGRFLWRLSKRISLIRKLVGAKTEAEFIQVIIDSFLRKIRLLRIALALSAFYVLIASFAAYFALIGLAFSPDKWMPGILAQDSKRVRGRKGRSQFRVNAKRGPDS